MTAAVATRPHMSTMVDMPNWCSNRMVIRGPKADRDTLEAAVNIGSKGNPEILSSLHPMPEELAHTSAPNRDASPEQRAYLLETYGADNWYDWANSPAGWGTKWGDCDTDIETSDDEIRCRFETAWGPPVEGVCNISARYPTLEFTLEYAEPGMCFSGTVVVREGLVVLADSRDSCDSDFALECGYDFDEDSDELDPEVEGEVEGEVESEVGGAGEVVPSPAAEGAAPPQPVR